MRKQYLGMRLEYMFTTHFKMQYTDLNMMHNKGDKQIKHKSGNLSIK